MADDILKNPPTFDGAGQGAGGNGSVAGEPVTHGTILKYGISDLTPSDLAAILIDSYSRGVKFANTDEIIGQDGLVKGLRMSDVRVDISVSGRILASATAIAKAGTILTINGDKSVITEVSMSAGSKDFVKVDIKATSYEGISALAPYNL